jgi:uncharacterized membrane protein YjgN (DUF898 family)
MEEPKSYQISFSGTGGSLFSIQIVNLLLMIVTLGLYYPWAKARTLQFLYSTTQFEESPFQFHGTGKEMFKGFIKAIAIIIAIYAIPLSILYFLEYESAAGIAILFLYAGIIAIVPLAIHGSYRYRMSRTTWRGIRLGYRGDRGELMRLFYRDLFLTIITLGIYSAWLTVHLRSYVLSNIRFGDARFKWDGEGHNFFWLNIQGYLFTVFTLGIYFFWWQRSLFNYYVNNLVIEKGENRIAFISTATGAGFAGLMIVNLLIVIFTFGLGVPWAITRTLNFAFANVEMEGDIDMDEIVQTEQEYKDATGEDVADFFDFDFVI